MSLLEELSSGFQALNIKVEDRVLNKCVEMCTQYNIEAEDFLDQWFAYTASHLNGAPPTLDSLARMERKEFQQSKHALASHNSSRNYSAMDVDMEVTAPIEDVSQVTLQYSQIEPSQPTQYTQRGDARSVQCEFGAKSFFDSDPSRKVAITVLNEAMKGAKFMYEKLLLRHKALNDITKGVVDDIVEYHKLELTKEKLKEYAGEMVICGRICSETMGKINPQSVFLEGLLELYRGQTLKLDLDKMDKLALFSGQIVALKGNNIKNRLAVTEIFNGAPLQPSEPLADIEKIQIVIACGPFTLATDLTYEPLDDLTNYVLEFKPNILILMGPFLDCSNPLLETLGECYDTFYENIVEDLMRKVDSVGVQVILVPSDKDVHLHPIFPTVPYKLKKSHPNLKTAPNPTLLDLDGFIVGASTADVLFHIGKNEFYKESMPKSGTDRMTRLAKYVLDQRCFYPLYPQDADLRVDYQLLEKYGMLEKTPHVLILPSNLRHFIKKIDNCLVVNPERLAKGQVGGTFARIEVRPGHEPLLDRISCQILRM